MNIKAGILWITALILLPGCSVKMPVSNITFDGIYRMKDADNIEFAFSEDGSLVISQQGVYEYKESESGEPILRICLADTSRELPEDYDFTEYLMKKRQEQIMLTLTVDTFDLNANPMALSPLEGENGLLSGAMFEGTYQIGEDGDSYQYLFWEDGSIVLQIKQRYYADERQMTLSDHAGSTDYLYEIADDTLTLKNAKGDLILTLEKEPAL